MALPTTGQRRLRQLSRVVISSTTAAQTEADGDRLLIAMDYKSVEAFSIFGEFRVFSKKCRVPWDFFVLFLKAFLNKENRRKTNKKR